MDAILVVNAGSSSLKFQVFNHRGIVYEKDLGPRTGAIAARMSAFNPDRTWRRLDNAGQPPTGTR
jgi:acetate kinase